jgi:isopenicillin-N epimerase
LSKLCKERLLAAFPDAHFYAPNISELSSGLSAFNPYDDQHDLAMLTAFRDKLRENTGFIIRTTDFKVHSSDVNDSHALRISTHLFHDEKDIFELVNAMQQIYQTI